MLPTKPWDQIIPSSPLEVGITIVSHFTLARAGASRPPHMKFLTMPLIWEHILGLGFQDAAMYPSGVPLGDLEECVASPKVFA